MNKKLTKNVRKLTQIFEENSTLLVLMQNNPDPDSIAAAVALRKIANSLGDIKCSITHGGTVGRGENRALVRYLNLNLLKTENIDFAKFDLIAVVDTQPGTGNNSLPENITADIVFDHHPMKQLSRSAQVYDIRTKYGATSTILIEYLMELKIEIDIPLATALLYAIRSDTQDLGREATQADILAIEKLYPIANKRMLSLIQRGRVPKVYFSMLAKALKNAIICGNAIVTHLGSIDNPDMIGEVADLLLREDKTVWTMCTGIFEERFLLSIRTSDQNNRADKVIKLVVGRKGSGGGHLTYSGGQIPLKNLKRIKTNQLEEKLEKKFLKIIGIDESKKESLIDF